eukprot:scaffold22946_cov16-Prasinocladus_malaysianus.AAC.1
MSNIQSQIFFPAIGLDDTKRTVQVKLVHHQLYYKLASCHALVTNLPIMQSMDKPMYQQTLLVALALVSGSRFCYADRHHVGSLARR